MRLVYVIRRYTPQRSNCRLQILHLPNLKGLPICGAKSAGEAWVEADKPTCKRCIGMAKAIGRPIR